MKTTFIFRDMWLGETLATDVKNILPKCQSIFFNEQWPM
jgi:hypothetical protein